MKLTRLEELIKKLPSEERKVAFSAEREFKRGKTYENTECFELREKLTLDYIENRLQAYRHFSYLPVGHYLRD